jgi:hypothetical protein
VGKTETFGASGLPFSHTRLAVYNS